MSYELKMKLLMHLVCIVQWGVFALIHWEMLGKGKWKHPFACTALAMCGMLVISLWIDFGFFNAASIAFNVLYLLVTSAFFGGTIRQKLMSCMANGVVCLLTENTVIYLYTYLEAVPPAQVIRQPLGVLLMVAAMLIWVASRLRWQSTGARSRRWNRCSWWLPCSSRGWSWCSTCC